MKVLVLGSTGMAGHVIYKFLESKDQYNLSNIVYHKKLNEESILLDVRNKELLKERIKEINPEVLINCVGALLKVSNSDYATAVYLNAFLPHYLSQTLTEIGGRLIHISTDCVFSGQKGSYQENDFKDADDIYGRSKALGEVINDRDLTFRTSIIGPELKTAGEGLMHWLFSQEGIVNGYEKSIWSGVTTLQLAIAVDQVINNKITGLYQLTNGIKINKYSLLVLTKNIFNLKNIEINRVEGKNVDKSLVDNRKESSLAVPVYEVMLKELYTFMHENKNYYKHYKLAL
jgi:dTDP-4-dehydrorhamnose reductase